MFSWEEKARRFFTFGSSEWENRAKRTGGVSQTLQHDNHKINPVIFTLSWPVAVAGDNVCMSSFDSVSKISLTNIRRKKVLCI